MARPWDIAHPEKVLEAQRKYDRAHREEKRAYRKHRNAAHPDHARGVLLRRRYGLTIEQYDSLCKAQNGACAICSGDNKGRRLIVDHDHTTGRVRGLLCFGCNISLGHLADDVARIARMQEYLR